MGYQIITNPFLEDVQDELHRAQEGHAKLNSLHEAFAVILEEVEELKAEVWKKRQNRDPKAIRQELIQIAAMAWRTARDLGLEDR